jgi:O-antigen/teichoic acid export membrane protein
MAGAGWTYGAQLCTILLQILYAAGTSRLTGADSFGTYSIALTSTGLITLIASGGLAQSVGRMKDLATREVSALCTYALLLGIASAIATLSFAPLLASLWGSVDATNTIRLLALNAFTAPLLGVAAGLMRRLGVFRDLAIRTLLSNIIGMVIGLIAVSLFANAESLVVSAILSQSLVVVLAMIRVRGHIRFGTLRGSTESLSFSWKIILASLLQYSVANIPRLSASRVLGASSIGQWRCSAPYRSSNYKL